MSTVWNIMCERTLTSLLVVFLSRRCSFLWNFGRWISNTIQEKAIVFYGYNCEYAFSFRICSFTSCRTVQLSMQVIFSSLFVQNINNSLLSGTNCSYCIHFVLFCFKLPAQHMCGSHNENLVVI